MSGLGAPLRRRMARHLFLAGVATAIAGAALQACRHAGPSAATSGVDSAREAMTVGGIAWDVAGNGPPLVLVHGAMLDRRQWNPQRPLRDHFTVIRYDTRWHGRSAGADTAFRSADDLAGVLDAAHVARASIVGLSNGARIAVDFALAYPNRVDRLVLVSPGLGGYRPVAPSEYWVPMIAALRAGDVDKAAALLAASPVMEVGSADSAWVAAMVREHARVFRQDPGRELQPAPPAIRRLGEIRSPTLVINGTADLRDIVLTADTLELGIANARRERIQGARHLLNITHTSQFNRLVAEFLGAKPH